MRAVRLARLFMPVVAAAIAVRVVRRGSIGALLLALGLSLPAASSQAERADARQQPYFEIVRSYRTGSPGAAVLELLRWDVARVEAMSRSFESARAPDLGEVEAAVVLHTEVALAAAGIVDAARFGAHLDIAHRLVEWLHRRARLEPRVPRLDHRAWYLAVGRILPGLEAFDRATVLLKRAVQRFPDDAEMWLASGIASEAKARQLELELWQWHEPAPSSSFYLEFRRQNVDARTRLSEARAHYRRALALDAGLDVARLRLGRVLAVTGAHDEAERELREVVAHGGSPARSYLAYLLLGRVDEQRGRPAQAAESYRAALAQDPACETCRIALAHVLDEAGDAAAAREQVLALAARTAAGARRADEWWTYPIGQMEAGEALLAELQRAVRAK